jgi:hypothetical protein
VIRFSAALVAVAIAILIGGIAASELSLVYIAIVVSAVALVALATGVVLKREELFGAGQGLAPAGAGAGTLPPVRVGESYDQHRPTAAVPQPPLQGVVVGPGAAFGRNAQAASPQSAAPWEAPAARAPWPQTAPARPAAAPSSGTTPGGRAGSWGVPVADEPPASADVAAQGGQAAPWAWAPPSPSAAPPTAPAPDESPAAPGAGSGSVPPSWFDRRKRPASANAPATTPAPATGSGWPWSGASASTETTGAGIAAPEDTRPEDTGTAEDVKADGTAALNATTAPADAATADDDDDDWPTRYSWLEDEPGENGGEAEADLEEHAAQPLSAAGAFLAEEAEEPAAPAASAAPDTDIPERETPDAESPDPGTPDAGAPEATVTELGDADAALGADADPGVATSAASGDPVRLSLVTDPDPAAEAGSESPAGTAADAAPGTGLVAVIRGVPRYHDQDCVLIRFMPEGDTQQVSVAQAKESGCTPCAACQPEG